MIPGINNICDGCGDGADGGVQPILRLFDDQTLKIVEGANTTDAFDLSDFVFPTDGHGCINLSTSLNGELTLFDNDTTLPLTELDADTNYVRGIVVKVKYPSVDINGDAIAMSDEKVTLSIETVASGVYVDMPLHNLYIHFANPRSNDPLDLINRIKITNPSTLFKVDVTGLIVYGRTPE